MLNRTMRDKPEMISDLGAEIRHMIKAYNHLRELNKRHYLLDLVRVYEGEERFISDWRFTEKYYGILNSKGEIEKEAHLRDKNAIRLYRKDLEEAIKENKK